MPRFTSRLQTHALDLFRKLPRPVKHRLVQLGTPNYTVGGVCAMRHDGRYLFLSQPHRRGWSLPGGLLSGNELPADGVAREVFEETQIVVELIDPTAFIVDPPMRRVDIVYLLETTQRPLVQLGSEARGYDWLAPSDIGVVDRPTMMIINALTNNQPRGPGRILGPFA